MLISCSSQSSQSDLEIYISNMSFCLIFPQKLYLLLKECDIQASLIWGKSERAGAAQPEEKKAQGQISSISVHKRWREGAKRCL